MATSARDEPRTPRETGRAGRTEGRAIDPEPDRRSETNLERGERSKRPREERQEGNGNRGDAVRTPNEIRTFEGRNTRVHPDPTRQRTTLVLRSQERAPTVDPGPTS